MTIKRIWWGKALLTMVALLTVVGPLVADWNATHLFNPRWPPHARFHGAQTMATGVLLGSAALPFIWRTSRSRKDLAPAVLLVGLYWAAQALAFVAPGVAWIDPDLLESGESLGDVPIQLVGSGVIAVVILVAALLADPGRGRNGNPPAS